jgi:protein arginine N-methyltransferase 5
MLTTPITTPYFHSRVLALLSSHLSELDQLESSTRNAPPAPIIPPLGPVDTPLTPCDTVSQLIGYTSSWIDLCSPDPLVANISRQVLNLEVAYASFCGIGNLIIPGPKLHRDQFSQSNGVAQYARTIQEVLSIGSFMNMSIHMAMDDRKDTRPREEMGDLSPFSREEYFDDSAKESQVDLFASWDAWNLIRDVCKYNSRLSVALALPRSIPGPAIQTRWFAEPLRLLTFSEASFVTNTRGYPVVTKAHQALLTKYMRLKHAPWLMLCDVAPIPGLNDPTYRGETADGFLSPSVAADITSVASPTPSEAAAQAKSRKEANEEAGPMAHLQYLRHLQRTQPARSTIEKYGTGYQDYLQAPLQPLTDNLESVTYEVFEKDPVKYDWYEKAIAQALVDWRAQQKPTSGPNGTVVVAVAGSGRGPLVTRALRASASTGVPIDAWAVEKNPNAYVLLQRHNEETWNGMVTVVKSDMRAWKGPHRVTPAIGEAISPETAQVPSTGSQVTYGKVDILVSELLGSFADNELSPECLDGVQHVLSSQGISIPSSYTAHLSPISAPRLHAEISHRAANDDTATETPYVVMLHAIDFLATSVPGHPQIQQSWEFCHPLPASTLAIAESRRSGGVSGGGGGSMAGGDGANEHNTRYFRHKFICQNRGVVNGLAGYFETVLYEGKESKVELSTRPDTIDAKSKDMISWFPIYFPLKVCTPYYMNIEFDSNKIPGTAIYPR